MTLHEQYAEHELLTPDEERGLGLRIMDGDEDAFLELTRKNLRLVVSIVKAWWNPNLPLTFDEMVSTGTAGLMNAASRFNPERGKFSTYAAWYIKQAIRQHILEWSSPMRIPSSTGSKRGAIQSFILEFSTKNGREPYIEELRERFPNIGQKRLQALVDTLKVIHLDGPISQGEGQFGDLIQDKSSRLPIWNLIEEENPGEVKRLMSCLNERERLVIALRFGLGGSPPMTLEEVSEEIDRTRERVRQIQKKALGKMREKVNGVNKI